MEPLQVPGLELRATDRSPHLKGTTTLRVGIITHVTDGTQSLRAEVAHPKSQLVGTGAGV